MIEALNLSVGDASPENVRRPEATMDCPGCGAPEGYPPAGPCRDHGTMRAVGVFGDEDLGDASSPEGAQP